MFNGVRGNAVKTTFVDNFPEWEADFVEGSNATAAKALLAEKISELPPEVMVWSEERLPSGISASIKKFLPDPIYIPAVKNINDDLKTTQSTSFGRLIGLLMRDLEPDLNAISDSLNHLNRILNRVRVGDEEVDERNEKVRSLEELVESYLEDNFPGAKVQLEIPPPEIKTILNSAQIYVDDGSRDLIDQKGDGIKRALTFALLRAYVSQQETRAGDAGHGPSFSPYFLFEEPEFICIPNRKGFFSIH
ncbi:MAG: AAA family ATPase [Haliea sp.]|nr:AAA family ATPase [Haliea sp.]